MARLKMKQALLPMALYFKATPKKPYVDWCEEVNEKIKQDPGAYERLKKEFKEVIGYETCVQNYYLQTVKKFVY